MLVVFSAVELGKKAEGAAVCAHCGAGGGEEQWWCGGLVSYTSYSVAVSQLLYGFDNTPRYCLCGVSPVPSVSFKSPGFKKKRKKKENPGQPLKFPFNLEFTDLPTCWKSACQDTQAEPDAFAVQNASL